MPGFPGAGSGNNDLLQMQMALFQQNSIGMMGMAFGIPGLMPSVLSSAAQFHQPAEKNQIKLFVGGLAFQTSEQELLQYFEKYGKVENTIVMRDKATGRGRGFGFVLVSFADESEAIDAKQ